MHVVAPEPIPMEKILGADVGKYIRKLHEKHGITFHLGNAVTSIGARSVTLKSGEELPTDLVVVGVGVRPAVALAERAVQQTGRAPLRCALTDITCGRPAATAG